MTTSILGLVQGLADGANATVATVEVSYDYFQLSNITVSQTYDIIYNYNTNTSAASGNQIIDSGIVATYNTLPTNAAELETAIENIFLGFAQNTVATVNTNGTPINCTQVDFANTTTAEPCAPIMLTILQTLGGLEANETSSSGAYSPFGIEVATVNFVSTIYSIVYALAASPQVISNQNTSNPILIAIRTSLPTTNYELQQDIESFTVLGNGVVINCTNLNFATLTHAEACYDIIGSIPTNLEDKKEAAAEIASLPLAQQTPQALAELTESYHILNNAELYSAQQINSALDDVL